MAAGAKTTYPSTSSAAAAVVPPRASSAYPVTIVTAVAIQSTGAGKPPAARHAGAIFMADL